MTVELIDVLGEKADGTRELIGKGPMSPVMKIPEILRNYGLSPADCADEEVGECANSAMFELVRWMIAQGWTPPPTLAGMPSHLALLKTALHRLEDMLRDDDGQAYKEARKFVEQARKVVPE